MINATDAVLPGARRRISLALRAVLVLALSGLAAFSPAAAQSDPAAAPASSVAAPPPLAVGAGAGTRGAPDCNSQIQSDEGTHASGRISISTPWQPTGGQVLFDLETPQTLPADITIKVCFRWRSNGQTQGQFLPGPLVQINRFNVNNNPNKITVSAMVPDLNSAPTGVARTFQGLVPVADFRIIITVPGRPTIDTVESIGITSRWVAAVTAAFTVVIALFLLRRVELPSLQRTPLLLRLIAADDKTASLSQFQIMLWSFLIGAAAVYVMTLSGNLIVISDQALVLLGITGVAALGTQFHDLQKDSRSAPQAAGQAAPPAAPSAPALPAPATAAPAAPPAPAHEASTPPATGGTAGSTTSTGGPNWGDLVRWENEIDVTRVQMLYFTLIVAAFVGLTVIRTSSIPEIPESYLYLMGISNGVYLTRKFAPMLTGGKGNGKSTG